MDTHLAFYSKHLYVLLSTLFFHLTFVIRRLCRPQCIASLAIYFHLVSLLFHSLSSLHRSRPVARVIGEIRFSNNSVDLNDVKRCRLDSSSFVCIDLLLCMRMAGAHLPSQIWLRVRLQGDSGRLSGPSRVILQASPELRASLPANASNGRSIEFTTSVSSGPQLTCHPPISVLIKVTTVALCFKA